MCEKLGVIYQIESVLYYQCSHLHFVGVFWDLDDGYLVLFSCFVFSI